MTFATEYVRGLLATPYLRNGALVLQRELLKLAVRTAARVNRADTQDAEDLKRGGRLGAHGAVLGVLRHSFWRAASAGRRGGSAAPTAAAKRTLYN